MYTRKQAVDAKRIVEGPLARMRFLREDRLWINDDLRRDAENILNDIMGSFEEGDYDYVVGRVEMAKSFLAMLDEFNAWVEKVIVEEYSTCPICGQPLAKEHFCSDEWQEIMASRAGNAPAFEVKATENEAGCPIICLTAQRVEEKFELRMVLNYYPWHETITTTSWFGVTQEERELLDQIKNLRKLEMIIFQNGSDPKGGGQLKMVGENEIFVCHRSYDKLIDTGVPYLCRRERLIGTNNGVRVVAVIPICPITKMEGLQNKLIILREKEREKRVRPLIENLQEKFLSAIKV